MDKEVQDKFIEVDEKIDRTNQDIEQIKIQLQTYAEDQKEFKKEVKGEIGDLKNITLTTSNSMISMMGQLMINKQNTDAQLIQNQQNNETQKEISKTDSRTKIIVQVLISIVALIGVFFAGTQL